MEPKLKDFTQRELDHVNIIAWINNNGLLTENDVPFEFDDHRFLIQPMTDMSPEQWWTKCAQVGGTDGQMVKAAFLAKEYHMNGIYVLPTRSVVKDFVKPKVNKIYLNKVIAESMDGVNNDNLKAIGNRFVYFRGAFSESEAIGIQADFVMGDEYDRSNQKVLKTYRSRLDASKYRYYWMYSNPSIPGFGVDEGYQKSDQMHWFVTCHSCGHEMYMDYERDETYENHYVFIISREPGAEDGFYACGRCHHELTNKDRKNGRWVAKHPEKHVRGYWFSQVFMPWIPASKIIADDGDDQAFFHNFTLGKAYVNSDSQITREMILRNYVRGKPIAGRKFMGIDTGKDMHWMLGDSEGATSWGSTRDWDEIERMIVANQALTVIDPNPNPRKPLELVKKYPGLVHLNYYVEDTKTSEISVWASQRMGQKQNTILTDRTRAFDRQLYYLSNTTPEGEATYNTMYKHENQSELDIVIEHWSNIHRQIEERAKGGSRAVWRRPQGKADHLAHANIYMEIAREYGKALSGTGIVRSSAPRNNAIYQPKTNHTLIEGADEGTIQVEIDPAEIARKANKRGKKWG